MRFRGSRPRLVEKGADWWPGQSFELAAPSEHAVPAGALLGNRRHLDHSCVSRAEYDQALRAVGHWRWRARDAERQLAELRKGAV